MSSASDPPVSSALPSDALAHKDDRTALIEKARSFLLSPPIRHEDETAKRTFLQQKGLSHAEINRLMQELVRFSCFYCFIWYLISEPKPPQPPPIPPRTYPPPPPSNLPVLLTSLLRVFTWASGLSAILFVGYYVCHINPMLSYRI